MFSEKLKKTLLNTTSDSLTSLDDAAAGKTGMNSWSSVTVKNAMTTSEHSMNDGLPPSNVVRDGRFGLSWWPWENIFTLHLPLRWRFHLSWLWRLLYPDDVIVSEVVTFFLMHLNSRPSWMSVLLDMLCYHFKIAQREWPQINVTRTKSEWDFMTLKMFSRLRWCVNDENEWDAWWYLRSTIWNHFRIEPRKRVITFKMLFQSVSYIDSDFELPDCKREVAEIAVCLITRCTAISGWVSQLTCVSFGFLAPKFPPKFCNSSPNQLWLFIELCPTLLNFFMMAPLASTVAVSWDMSSGINIWLSVSNSWPLSRQTRPTAVTLSYMFPVMRCQTRQ